MNLSDPNEEFSIEMSTRARVLVWAPRQPKSCVFAFHGYAEGPRVPLEALLGAGFEDCLIVAPMAPHHFYNRAGEVVASWMTRLDRDQRIEELLSHASALWAEIQERYGNYPLDLFGFSQGAAHAYRVALLAELPVRQCFVLAGDLPPELKERVAKKGDPGLALLVGEDDDRVSRETMELDARQLRARGYNVELSFHPGGHEYLPPALAEMRSRIPELSGTGRAETRKETD